MDQYVVLFEWNRLTWWQPWSRHRWRPSRSWQWDQPPTRPRWGHGKTFRWVFRLEQGAPSLQPAHLSIIIRLFQWNLNLKWRAQWKQLKLIFHEYVCLNFFFYNLGRTGAARDDVETGSTATSPILAWGSVNRLLGSWNVGKKSLF